jgi:hypothetical protein
MAGVYSVKRDVISRTVFSLPDVTSRPMFASDTCYDVLRRANRII